MLHQVKTYKIKTNPNNPRLIKGNKFKKLVQSIKDFPEMLKLRGLDGFPFKDVLEAEEDKNTEIKNQCPKCSYEW